MKKSRDPKNSAHLVSSERYQYQVKYKSIKDKQKKKLLNKEINKIMTQIHNISRVKKVTIPNML